MKKKKRFIGITKKVSIGLVVAGCLIMAGMIACGGMIFKRSIEKRYNSFAYDIAETAEKYFTEDEIKCFADLVYKYHKGDISKEVLQEEMKTDRYQELQKQLDNLRTSMGANDVFLYCFDMDQMKGYSEEEDKAGNWNPILYIMDSYPQKEDQYDFGDVGAMQVKYIEEAIKVVETGKRSDNYFISKGKFGNNTSAMLPIVIDGKTVALIGVEIPMTTLHMDIQFYVLEVLKVGSIITVLLIIFTIMYYYKNFVSPINIISKETGSFVKNNVMTSEEMKKIQTHDEIQLLSENIIQMEKDIRDYVDNITAITAEKERVGAELNVATHIQKSMLPCIFPAFPERKEFDIYAMMDPAKEVGGDFYDFFMVDQKHLAIVMADVSGKGIPAALFMVIGKTLIKDHTQPGRDLGDVFTKVNNLLCESNSEELFITAFEGVLDLETGHFVFVNAGHELPFIAKKGKEFKPYQVRRAFVLAGMEDIRYKAGEMYLEPGDRIFQYTDGIPEATDAENKMYGMQRLEDVLNTNKEKTPEELIHTMRQDINEFVGDAPQFDDITMLCLEYKKKLSE